MKMRFAFLVFGFLVLASGCLRIEVSLHGTQTPQLTAKFTPTTDELARLSSLYPCISGKSNLENAYVLKVFDGDSILVEMGGRQVEVRYIGIDAPEFDAASWIAAERSADVNRSLVLFKTISMVRDISETDRYDRLLRYVFVGDVFVNYELVKQGAAEAKVYTPDTACQGLFAQGMQ
jgi:endonuclease YncB( thermonuclease family)